MFRTEVVKSKNLRKSPLFVVYNVIATIVFIFVLLLVTRVIDEESQLGKTIYENYNTLVQPVVMGIALLVIVFSTIIRNSVKSPKRLGSLEIDENELKYLVNDELEETISLSDIQAIDFEFYSFRMRGNPMGCMNYLTLQTSNGEKQFEIIVANSMVKAELGSLLNNINKKVPVNVKYAYYLKKILKDNDFKFD